MKKNLLYIFIFAIVASSLHPGFGQTGKKVLQASKYLEERGEVDFNVITNDQKLINELSKILSVVGVNDNIIKCNANAGEFREFLSLGLEYFVLPPAGYYYKPVDYKGVVETWQSYPTYEEYDSIMHDFALRYPDICIIDTIGYSVENRLLLAIKISDNPTEPETEPEVFLTSTMHGDETGGYILMLRLIDYLLENYPGQSRITGLVDNLQLWINPLANPDGTYAGGNNSVSGATRRNANGVDLNRNYPDPQDGEHPDGNEYQPETSSMMDFMEEHHFVISANFHSGAEVVNYPWDTWQTYDEDETSFHSPHPDDNWFQLISKEYADTVHFFGPVGYFTNPSSSGFVLGGNWYMISGGRQDYVTYFLGGREVTIELDYSYITPESDLDDLWNFNYRSFLNYISQALYGIHGEVVDSVTGDPVKAEIGIIDHDQDSSQVFSDSVSGKFVRLISEGVYDLKVTSDGYEEKIIDSVIVNNRRSTDISVQLVPEGYGINNRLNDEGKMLAVYPNPVKGVLNVGINAEKPGDFTLEIISIDGKVLYSDKEIHVIPGGSVFKIRLNKLKPGIYFARLKNNKDVRVEKFVLSE